MKYRYIESDLDLMVEFPETTIQPITKISCQTLNDHSRTNGYCTRNTPVALVVPRGLLGSGRVGFVCMRERDDASRCEHHPHFYARLVAA